MCTTTLCGRYYDYSHFIKEKILHELSNVPTVIQLESGGASFKFTQSTSDAKLSPTTHCQKVTRRLTKRTKLSLL